MSEEPTIEPEGHTHDECVLCGHDKSAETKRAPRPKWTDSILRNFSVLILLGVLVGGHIFLVTLGNDGLTVAQSETPWVLALGGILGQSGQMITRRDE